MDKTVKMRAFSGTENNEITRDNLSDEQNKSLELTKKTTQLEEEKKKALELLTMVEQLRANLKQEQSKTAELTAQITHQGTSEIAVKEAQLEDEKSRSLEHLKTIVQLKESLKQEQTRVSELVKNAADQEALYVKQTNELALQTTQLEQEKRKSFEQLNTLTKLQESLALEQAKTTQIAENLAEIDAKNKQLVTLQNQVNNLLPFEAKAKELSDTLSKIASIATIVK